MRVLIVEENQRNAKVLRRMFRAHAYAADLARTREDTFYKIDINDYDLIVIDLEESLALEMVVELRKDQDVPVIVVGDRGTTEMLVSTLDAGADDFVVKPFEVLELMARVRAVLRRPRASYQAEKIVVGDLTIDFASRKVKTATNTEIVLTSKEFALLELFARNVDRVIGREEIAEKVWSEDFDPFSNLIEVYVNRLRKRLGLFVTVPKIETRRGSGYIMEVVAQLVIDS